MTVVDPKRSLPKQYEDKHRGSSLDLFEYILILTSVIYALAIAQILAGVSRMAQTSSEIEHYLPQKIWIFNLFLLVFLIWWATWEFRTVDWTFPEYAYLLIAPTLLFFACSLLTPMRFDGELANMEAHFARIRRPFFATFFLAMSAVIVDGSILLNEPVWHNGRYGHVILLVSSGSGYFISSKKGDTAIAVIVLIALTATAVSRFWLPR